MACSGAQNQEIKRFYDESRSLKSFEKLFNINEHIDANVYATDNYGTYNIINPDKHVVSKSEIYTAERINRCLRYCLAKFVRTSYSVSQSKEMVATPLYVWVFKHLIPWISL